MPTIRPLMSADVEAYLPLRLEMLSREPLAFGSSPGHDGAGDAAQLRASLANPEFVIMGAWSDLALIGAAGLRRAARPKQRHIAEVWGVYVKPEARGRGVGRAIMESVLTAARGWSGVRSVRLSVSSEATAARMLYQSLGFEAWGVEPDCIRLTGREENPGADEIHMILRL